MIKVFAKSLLIVMCITFLRFIYLGEINSFNDMLVLDKFLFVLGSISFFLFWFLMLKHFFNNKNIRRKVLWGFSLIFLSWLAAIAYFYLHFSSMENQ